MKNLRKKTLILNLKKFFFKNKLKIKNNDKKETRKDLSKTNILIKFVNNLKAAFFQYN